MGEMIASILLKARGFDVVDLNMDVFAERFVEAAQKYEPDVLAMSALLTRTMLWRRSRESRI
jgi:5-methyltetrahydrofolate--homocysteine methyltransferase